MKFKKKAFLSLLLFNVLLAFGQTNGHVIYQQRFIKKLSTSNASKVQTDRMNDKIIKFENRLELLMEDIHFDLFINANESVFKIESASGHENNVMYKPLLFLTDTTGEYYLDSDSNETINKRIIREKNFLIHVNKPKWKLIQETKMINQYKCYKAITTKHLFINGIDKKINIIAWYTPDIPMSFGPKGYGFLPGLILSLQYGENIEFIAKEINLKPEKPIMIKKFYEGEKIEEEKYWTIMNKNRS